MVEGGYPGSGTPSQGGKSPPLQKRRGSNLTVDTAADAQDVFVAREPATTSPKRLSRISTTGSIAQGTDGGERKLRRRASTLFAPSMHELKVLHRYHGHSVAVSHDGELASPASAPVLEYLNAHSKHLRKNTLTTLHDDQV